MADSKEAVFQQDIIDALAARGWRVGKASGYDRRTALYTEDLLGYFKDAWPWVVSAICRRWKTPCCRVMPPLRSTWEEICVQQQCEESLYWDDRRTALAIGRGCLSFRG
ncbi:hypothetical protein [Pseudomonas sp. 2FG]|uniref:hypothetical protein n=1 Tax=Pseudomonas sp. 2FG TaxID=2502191 RepID=UPI0010F6A69E|nr:hypothetical protein [Pseudomonas sp. 2FG]